MINFFKIFLLFIIATISHWAFTTGFYVMGFGINLMLTFAIAFCTVLKPVFGYPVVFLCGLFLDFFSTKLFGGSAFIFTLFAWFIYSISDRFDFDNPLFQMALVFVLVVIGSCMNSLLIRLFTAGSLWPGMWRILGGALISSFCAPLIFWLVHKILSGGEMCKTH